MSLPPGVSSFGVSCLVRMSPKIRRTAAGPLRSPNSMGCRRGAAPSVPPRCTSWPVSQLRSIGRPSSDAACTYWQGLPGSGGVKPTVSMANGEPFTSMDGARERRRVHQEQVLPGNGEQAERRPHVPGAEPARVVVAGQPAAAGSELVVDHGVHDLGGAVGPTGVVVRPRRLHVWFVVQPFEPVERVTRPPSRRRSAVSPTCFTGRRRSRRTGRANRRTLRRRPRCRCAPPCRA